MRWKRARLHNSYSIEINQIAAASAALLKYLKFCSILSEWNCARRTLWELRALWGIKFDFRPFIQHLQYQWNFSKNWGTHATYEIQDSIWIVSNWITTDQTSVAFSHWSSTASVWVILWSSYVEFFKGYTESCKKVPS